jgi:hypothetical protein
LADEVGPALCQALCLGGREHRRNLELLSSAPAAPQEYEIHQYAGALDGRDKRRTLVVRIFPNAAACLRLVRALAVEVDENWIEAMQYLNMEPLAEQKREALRRLGEAA